MASKMKLLKTFVLSLSSGAATFPGVFGKEMAGKCQAQHKHPAAYDPSSRECRARHWTIAVFLEFTFKLYSWTHSSKAYKGGSALRAERLKLG